MNSYGMTVSLLMIGLVLILADANIKLKHSVHRRISILLISVTMLYIAMDCFWLLEYMAESFHRPLFIALNTCFYLVYITLPYVWFLFAQHFAIGAQRNKLWIVLSALPYLFNLLLVVFTTLGSGALWTIGDEFNRYTRGPWFQVFSNLTLFYYFFSVAEILVLLCLRRHERRRMLWITFGFSAIPAVGVCVYTYLVPSDVIYPFLPSCFFIGVLFAYILLISELYREAEEENVRLVEAVENSAKISELQASITSLLTNMPALTFSKDVENGKYLACNQAFAEYAHKETPDGVVGLTDFEIFDSETAAHFVEDDRKTLSMDEPYIFFESVPDAAGKPKAFQTTKLKFTDASGRLCTLGMCVDVTEMMHMKQVTEQARMENEAKSAFLSNMSHDIRTPMNAIIGFTNLAMQEGVTEDKVNEYLGKIRASSNHLLSLINDVLEMSRIESGKIELNEALCSLPEVLHELNTIMVGQIEGKHQELTMDAVGVQNETVYCDKLRLNQVLINLLSNAVKYTQEGGKISVRLLQHAGAPAGYGDYEIRVKDNGMGMTPEFAAKVFDPFERENNSTISGIQGTGLGMTITKRIVDLMNGSISVQTAPNEGSEFTVKVRLRVEPCVLDRQIPSLKGIHALVVDDDFDTCDSVTRMLTDMGLHAEWTLSGKEAVLRAVQAQERGDRFGVFIVDLKMPDISGLETVRRIRKAVSDDSPILMITAYDWQSIREEAIAAGVNTFCNKPIFQSELHAALIQVIDDNGTRENATQEATAKLDLDGSRVLLVDDIEVNREIACMTLEMFSLKVDQAVNGEEAVEMVRSKPNGYYQCVLMDIQMPVMNGYEATRAIRALSDERAEIPIIAMTANAFDEDRRRALDCGMNAHIAKPIDVEQLQTVLSEILH